MSELVSNNAERAEALMLLSKLVESRAASDRQFKRAIATLLEDLDRIRITLVRKPENWRLNRAFHTVHVPSLIAAVSVLDDIDQMATVTDAEWHEVYANLSQAASLVRDARMRIEKTRLTEAKVELEVLSDYAKPPAIPYRKASLLTRAFDTVAHASETMWEGAKSGASSIGGLTGNMKDGFSDVATRAASVPTLADNLRKTMSGTLSDTLAKPLSMRLKASGRALTNGLGTGVGVGFIVGILCPPLLPVSAGGAVLIAMQTWRKEMEKAQALNAEERERRIFQLAQERAEALKQLTHGAAAFQLETDEISMTLDAETGDADAVLLTGKHAGSTWSSLTSAQKAEAAVNFTGAAAEIIRIIRIATE